MDSRLPDTGELRRLVAESVNTTGFEPITASFAPAMPTLRGCGGSGTIRFGGMCGQRDTGGFLQGGCVGLGMGV